MFRYAWRNGYTAGNKRKQNKMLAPTNSMFIQRSVNTVFNGDKEIQYKKQVK